MFNAPKIHILIVKKKKGRHTSQHASLANTKQSTKNYYINSLVI